LLRPKVTIEPDVPLVASTAINVPFKVTNESELAIYSLTSFCFINWLRFSGGGGASHVKLTSDSVAIHKLRRKESDSIVTHIMALGSPPGESVTGGDITFTVKFIPQIRFWQPLTEQRRFEGRIAEDGKLKWYPKALDE
jgi:hypothetical protein